MMLFARAVAALVAFATAFPVAFADGPIVDAIDDLSEKLRGEAVDLGKKSSSLTITKVEIPEEFPNHLRSYLVKKLEGALTGPSNIKVVQCKQCETPTARIEDGKVKITRGLTTRDAIQKKSAQLGVTSYSEVRLAYTGTSAKLAVNNYNSADGAVNWTRSYSTRLVATDKSSTQFSLSVIQLAGLSRAGYPAGASLFFGERTYGLGSIGLGILGAKKHNEFRDYAAAGPQLFLNMNEIFGAPWSWGELLTSVRLHYGWYGKHHRDILFGLGTKLLVGATYHVTLEGLMTKDLSAEPSPKDFSEGENGVFKNTNLPASMVIGFGFDLG